VANRAAGTTMNNKKTNDRRAPPTYAPPTPKVSRQKAAKVLSPAERAAFLASRPELKPKT
jgi:hypothetical protein